MSKFNAAESIRGLACMLVIFSHLALTFFPFLHNAESKKHGEIQDFIYNSPFAFFYSGEAAVFIFFVLSGYVLTHSILKSKNTNMKLVSMTIKRYPRLAIPAIFSCIFAYLAFTIRVDGSNVSSWFNAYISGANVSLIEALYQGSIHAFIYGSSSINWVLWTMQIELIGSLLLFALLFIRNHNSRAIFHSACLVLPALFVVISPKFVLGMYAFVFGLYFYTYGKPIKLIYALPVLLIGLYFAGVHYTSASYAIFAQLLGKASYYILNFSAGLFVVYAVLLNKNISLFLDKKPLVELGKLSFSIYLIHLPVIYLFGLPSFNYLLSFFGYNSSALLASLISIISTLLISTQVTRYVDTFAINSASLIEKKFMSSCRGNSTYSSLK